LEIVADILTVALNGANKTRIVYRANLNFTRFHKYFSELLDKGLIVRADEGEYRTTDKGRRFLKIISNAEAIISS